MIEGAPEQQIGAMYSTLARAWGRQHWWPAKSPFEVIVGAFLTQNTSWTNVELAMRQLRAARVLSLSGIRRIPIRKLERLIRSSGYFRQKAARLKGFIAFVDRNYNGSLKKMFGQPTSRLRAELLSLDGVGPETADSILLYAGQHPVFVVDAYTRRIAARHGVLDERTPYEDIRKVFEGSFVPGVPGAEFARESSGGAFHQPSRMSLAPRSPMAQAFNEMHGMLVGVGKNFCLKSKPKCELCPLRPLLKTSIQIAAL